MKDKSIILVVDDEPQKIELLEAYLVPQGYEIVKAANGEEALGKLSDNPIDLILLDVMMPGMDGFEVIRRVRQDKTHRSLPIILVTVLRETEDRIKGIEAGCDDFISYPVDKMELLARIRSLLKVKAYNDLMRNYRKELESEVTRRTEELKHALEDLQQDIAERKQAEEALRETKETLHALVQASPLAIITLDPDGNVTLWNKAAEQMFGWPESEALGQFLPFVPDDNRDEHRLLRERVLRGEAFANIEVRRRKKDGSPIDISISTAPLRDVQGQVTGIMSVNTDITERKRKEEELRESEERFRLLLEQAPEAILVFDIDEKRFIQANAKAEKLFGCRREELLKVGPQHFYAPIQPDRVPIAESMKENVERVMAGEEVMTERLIHIAEGKDLYPVNSTWSDYLLRTEG